MTAGDHNRATDDGDGEAGTRRVVVTGREASQGEIILRTRRRRIIFIIGLAALVVMAVLVRMAA